MSMPRGVFDQTDVAALFADTRGRVLQAEQEGHRDDPTRRFCLTAATTGCFGQATSTQWVPWPSAVQLQQFAVILSAVTGINVLVSMWRGATLLATLTVPAGSTYVEKAPLVEDIPPGNAVWFTVDNAAGVVVPGLTALAWCKGYGGGGLLFDGGIP